MMTLLAKEQAKVMLAEKQEKAREQRATARKLASEKAALLRSKDAHRKIVLGGLVIAAEVDDWDPAEIVGALLLVSEQLAAKKDLRGYVRERGIQRMMDRADARAAERAATAARRGER